MNKEITDKDRFQEILIDKDNQYETGIHICFSSSSGTSRHAFNKALELIQRKVNRKLCRRDRYVNIKTRVQFYHFLQYDTHRHSHCILKIPSKYNKKHVYDLIVRVATELKEIRKCYLKKVYKTECASVIYSSSKLTLGQSNDDRTYLFLWHFLL